MTPAKRRSIYRRGQTGSKGNWLRTQNAEAALSRIGFAGCASRARGRHWSVSVTHRFLRRGCLKNPLKEGPMSNPETCPWHGAEVQVERRGAGASVSGYPMTISPESGFEDSLEHPRSKRLDRPEHWVQWTFRNTRPMVSPLTWAWLAAYAEAMRSPKNDFMRVKDRLAHARDHLRRPLQSGADDAADRRAAAQ